MVVYEINKIIKKGVNFIKLNKKIFIILTLCIYEFLGSVYVQANENKESLHSTNSIKLLIEPFSLDLPLKSLSNSETDSWSTREITGEIGKMKLQAIDPFFNPAKDNWMSRLIAKMTFGDESRYLELTQEHFNKITDLTYLCVEVKGITEGFIPSQIGNLINLKSIYLEDEEYGYNLKLPKEINNLSNLKSLLVFGFNCGEEDIKEASKLCLDHLRIADSKGIILKDYCGNYSQKSNKIYNSNNLEEVTNKDLELSKSKTLGKMKLHPIDPVSNPAEDNWLSREISRMVLGDESRYLELTQEHFNAVLELSYIESASEGFIPVQIGNLVNLKKISINNDSYNCNLKLPNEIGNLGNLSDLVIIGFKCNEESLKAIYNLPKLVNMCLNTDSGLILMVHDK